MAFVGLALLQGVLFAQNTSILPLSMHANGISASGYGLVMSLADSAPAVALKPDLYIAPLGSEMNGEAGKLARELRSEDFIVELGDGSFKLKKSFEAAAKVGARYVLFLGENEVQSNTFSLKNQETGEQISVPRSELVARLRELLRRRHQF